MLTITRIEKPEEMEKYKPDWERLLAVSDINNIFLTFEWVISWWQVFGEDHTLYVLIVNENSETIGIAPLMITGGSRKKIVRFIGNPNSDYNDFIGARKDEIIEAVLGCFYDHRSDWDLIEWSQIPESSTSLKILDRLLPDYPLPAIKKPVETVMAFEYTGRDEDRNDFALKRGSTFKRYQNFFKKLNGLSLERLRERDEIKKILPAFFQCHVTRWKSLPLPSKFHDQRMRRFHEILTDRLAPLERISFMILKHGRLPLAYLFAYDYSRTVHLYNVANESFHQRRSPGIIILHFLTEQFIRDGYDTVDFSRGAGSHKLRFINKTAENFRVAIFKSRTAYLRMLFKEKFKRALIDKKSGELISVVSAFKQQIGGGNFMKGINRTFSRIIRAIVSSHRFSIFTLNEECQMELRPPIDIEVKKLAGDDMESIANFYGILKDSDQHRNLEKRFEQGADCFAAISDEQIVSVLWGLHHEYTDKPFGPKLHPGQNEVVLADAHTADLYRDRGLQTFLAAHTADEYRRAGRNIIMAVASDDLQEFTEREGSRFKLIRRRRVIRIFGIPVVF